MQASHPAILFALLVSTGVAAEAPQLASTWKVSKRSPAAESFVISGTGERNNPLRKQLSAPFAERELFVRYTIRYAAASVDRPPNGDGEFFVLWLDQVEGNDRSTHAGGVPNIGIHVNGGENTFMVRYGAKQESYSKTRLVGGRDYHVIARLSKSRAGAKQVFDTLQLWIDPRLGESDRPHASVRSKLGPTAIRWLGFSTGRKTERGDRITVSNIRIASTWSEILGLPADMAVDRKRRRPVQASKPARKQISFRRDIYPILKSRCFACHAGVKASSGIRLDVWDEVLNRTKPGHPDAGVIVDRITTKNADKRMPPPGKGRRAINADELAGLKTWIKEGVGWDEALLPTPKPTTKHWAFQRITRPKIPRPKKRRWVRTPVDAFVAAKQEAAGIAPAPLAPAHVLRRRLALDLTGLPPSGRFDASAVSSPAKLHAAADDYVDRLLASPQYGERWGRHWLDVARFGESNGHQHNRDRPHAWRYRDYVVRAFQKNKPFNRFVLEQIAGDELPFNKEAIVATGFLAAARYSGNELDKEIQRNDILVDVVNTTGKAFLGVTLECAQCHTHKFDPISIRDYYRFQAFFTRGEPGNIVLSENPLAGELSKEHWLLFDRSHRRLIAQRKARGVPEPILITPKTVYARLTAAERRLMNQADRKLAAYAKSWAWYSPATSSARLSRAPHVMRWPLPRDEDSLRGMKTYLRLRGDVKSRGPEVSAGWPVVFGKTPQLGSHPRVQLAKWIASKNNPLTARVWVNRIWQWHFGRGLVESSGDFGTQGTQPSHPKLLDWLAAELIDHKWDTNHIHRLILRSNTYRQSSHFHADNEKRDPDNRLLWRWKPRRLEAEAIRDSVLAVSGLLDRRVGGPSVPVAKAGRSLRRSIYLQQKRARLPAFMKAFDSPNTVVSCTRRRTSTVAPQALHLLNSRFMQQAAAGLASRVDALSKKQSDQAAHALQLVLHRKPSADEIKVAQQLLNETSLQSLCLTLLNLNEFLYVP